MPCCWQHGHFILPIGRLSACDIHCECGIYQRLINYGGGAQVSNSIRLSRHRHQVVANLLMALGVDEDTAQADAEGMEHHVSQVTLKAFEAFLQARSVS